MFCFEINNVARDISVSRIGSIHDSNLERIVSF
jgi:hypothetical protein